jgi:hypothetical protein
MHIRSFISPIALAAALSLSTGAMAQTEATVQMRGVDIPAEDLAEVQSRCNTLLAESKETMASTGNDSLVDDGGDDDDADSGDADSGDADGGDADTDDASSDDSDDASTDDEDASGLDQALTMIDLDTITFEDCKNAGLVDSEQIVVE